MTNPPGFDVQVSHDLADLDQAAWDALSAGRPFQSYRWYRYGQKVMADCPPTYIILSVDGEAVARATFWLVRNEPLPLPPGIFRRFFSGLLNRWPLLICRSPLSFSSGLVLPPLPVRDAALQAICRCARAELTRQHGSFLLFDFLKASETSEPAWPKDFTALSVSDPGTIMTNRWETFDAYLASGNKKDRQHYKRTIREAEELGSRIEKTGTVQDIDNALQLIRQVEQRHNSPPNPWVRAMLKNLEMVNGSFLQAKIDEKLVGCGLLFVDNHAHMTATLGLAENTPFVYFQLIYASLQDAIERKVHLLRWGSGAYDVKRRLGFELEMKNSIVVAAQNPLMKLVLRWVKRYGYGA